MYQPRTRDNPVGRIIETMTAQPAPKLDLAAVGGYFENGSADRFELWPDDATRTWHVVVGGKSRGFGRTIETALQDAAQNMQGELCA